MQTCFYSPTGMNYQMLDKVELDDKGIKKSFLLLTCV